MCPRMYSGQLSLRHLWFVHWGDRQLKNVPVNMADPPDTLTLVLESICSNVLTSFHKSGYKFARYRLRSEFILHRVTAGNGAFVNVSILIVVVTSYAK
jgi:hypothetical protein